MRYFLVDYENVNWAGLYGISFLTEDDTVLIFYSDHADTVNFTTLDYIMRSKALIKRHRITKFGNNALDFQLATYVGYLLGTHAEGEVYIISKDQGYLSVLDFCRERLSNTGLKVEMYSSINGLLLKERSRNRNLSTASTASEIETLKPELEPLNETKLSEPPKEPAFKAAYVDAAKASIEQKQPEVLVKIVGKKQTTDKKVEQKLNSEEKHPLKIQMKVEDLIEKISSKDEQPTEIKADKKPASSAVKIMADNLTENISAKKAEAPKVSQDEKVETTPPSDKETKKPKAKQEEVLELPQEKKPAESKTSKTRKTPAKTEKKEKSSETEPKSTEKKTAPKATKEKKTDNQKNISDTILPDIPITADYLKSKVAASVSKIESLVDADEVVRDDICQKVAGFIMSAETKQTFYLSFTKTFGQKQGVEYFNVLKKDFPLLKAIADSIKKDNKLTQ